MHVSKANSQHKHPACTSIKVVALTLVGLATFAIRTPTMFVSSNLRMNWERASVELRVPDAYHLEKVHGALRCCTKRLDDRYRGVKWMPSKVARAQISKYPHAGKSPIACVQM